MFLPRLTTALFLLATGVIATVSASDNILNAREPPPTPACYRCWKHFDDWTKPGNETFILVSQEVNEDNVSCFYISEDSEVRQTFCTYDPVTGKLEQDGDQICPDEGRPIMKKGNCRP